MQPGDLLVVYSDGVTEATNPAGDEFGEARLLACLESVRDLPCDGVREAIQKAVLEFVGGAPPSDDVTLMVLRAR